MKKYVKLLKGKGLRSDLVFCMLLSRGRPLRFTGPASVWSGRIMAEECGTASAVCYSLWRYCQPRPRTAVFNLGCWHNDLKSPVLKHGPRSLTSMRVFGCKTHTRNESERRLGPRKRCTIDRSWCLRMDLSKSIAVGTRKMVNYAWIGWSQRKLWWRLVAVLTCKSIVEFGYRGERLIEPSSSWFLPKFPSG